MHLDTWTPQRLPITCYLCSADLDFTELGGEALKATSSTAVVCFGGGGVVKAEFANTSEDVNYLVVPIARRASGGGGREEGRRAVVANSM